MIVDEQQQADYQDFSSELNPYISSDSSTSSSSSIKSLEIQQNDLVEKFMNLKMNEKSESEFIIDQSSQLQTISYEKILQQLKQEQIVPQEVNNTALQLKQLISLLPTQYSQEISSNYYFSNELNKKKINNEYKSQRYQSKLIQRPFFQKSFRTKMNFQNKIDPIYSKQFNIRSQNYYSENIKISIQLCLWMKISKNILLCPYQSQRFDDSLSNSVVKMLQYDMKSIIRKQSNRRKQAHIQDGQVLCIKSKGIINYKGIYFIKRPSYKSSLKYYHFDTLKKGIFNVFQNLHNNDDQSIVIPCFNWGSLNTVQIGRNLINQIFKMIRYCKGRSLCTNLREIVLAVQRPNQYDIYCKILNSYIKQFQGNRY